MFVFIVLGEGRRFYETAASDGSIVNPGGDRSVTTENCWRERDKGEPKWEICARSIFFGTILKCFVA
jgi:hypothetical protein